MKELLLSLMMVAATAQAKVTDPAPLKVGAVTYESHLNHVKATQGSPAKALWDVEVYKQVEPEKPDPKKEKDVQWNIITSLRKVGDFLRVQNSRQEVFYLVPADGRLVDESFTAALKPERKAFNTVKHATRFSIGGQGFTGEKAPAEFAVEEIAKQRDAKQQLEKLLSEATLEGQMFALRGLKRVDPKAFQNEAKRYAKDGTRVQMAEGCAVEQQSVSETLKQIAAAE